MADFTKIHNAIILPHLDYCNELGEHKQGTHSQIIIIMLKKRALRMISNSHYINKFTTLCAISDASNFWSGQTECFVVYVCLYMFPMNSSLHSYPIRERYNFRKPLTYSTLSGLQSIYFTGVKKCNSIDGDLKSTTTFSRCKVLYKQSLCT